MYTMILWTKPREVKGLAQCHTEDTRGESGFKPMDLPTLSRRMSESKFMRRPVNQSWTEADVFEKVWQGEKSRVWSFTVSCPPVQGYWWGSGSKKNYWSTWPLLPFPLGHPVGVGVCGSAYTEGLHFHVKDILLGFKHRGCLPWSQAVDVGL